VGNTVNIKKATWTNTIGDPELIAYDAKRFNVTMSKERRRAQ